MSIGFLLGRVNSTREAKATSRTQARRELARVGTGTTREEEKTGKVARPRAIRPLEKETEKEIGNH